MGLREVYFPRPAPHTAHRTPHTAHHTQPLRPNTSQQVRNLPLFTPVLYLPPYRCSKCRPRRSSNSLIVPLRRTLSNSTLLFKQHEGERTHGAKRRQTRRQTAVRGGASRGGLPHTRTEQVPLPPERAASSTDTRAHTHTHMSFSGQNTQQKTKQPLRPTQKRGRGERKGDRGHFLPTIEP